MQFGSMLESGTIDAVFILRILQEEYNAKGKMLFVCFVDLDKAFHRVPKKVLEWAMRKKRIPEVLVRSVICLHERAKTRVAVVSELSGEFEVKVCMHHGSVLSPFPFTLVVDVVIEFAREDVLCELLHNDDLILMSETIEGVKDKFIFQIGAGLYAVGRPVQKRNDEDGQIGTIQSLPLERGASFNRFFGEPAHGPPHVAGGVSGPIGGCRDESRTDNPDLDLRHVFDRNNRKTDLI